MFNLLLQHNKSKITYVNHTLHLYTILILYTKLPYYIQKYQTTIYTLNLKLHNLFIVFQKFHVFESHEANLITSDKIQTGLTVRIEGYFIDSLYRVQISLGRFQNVRYFEFGTILETVLKQIKRLHSFGLCFRKIVFVRISTYIRLLLQQFLW